MALQGLGLCIESPLGGGLVYNPITGYMGFVNVVHPVRVLVLYRANAAFTSSCLTGVTGEQNEAGKKLFGISGCAEEFRSLGV